MRHVGSITEVCHWFAANRSPEKGDAVDYGRNSKDSISFSGNTLKSYATVICTRHKDKRAELTIVLLSEERYSNTTSKHLNEVSGAFRGHVRTSVLTVPHPDVSKRQKQSHNLSCHLENMNYLRWQLIMAIQSTTGRSDDWHKAAKAYRDYVRLFGLTNYCGPNDKRLFRLLDSFESGETSVASELDTQQQTPLNSSLRHENELMREVRKEVNSNRYGAIAVLLGLQNSSEPSEPFDVFQRQLKRYHSQHQASIAQQNSQYRYQQCMMKANRQIEPAEAVSVWRETGEFPLGCRTDKRWHINKYTPAVDTVGKSYSDVALLRVNGSTVQTSNGVSRLSVKECRLIWRAMRRLWEVRHNPGQFDAMAERMVRFTQKHRIQRAYTIDHIERSNGGIKAGCHWLPFSEMAQIAVDLGFEPHKLDWRQKCLSYSSN